MRFKLTTRGQHMMFGVRLVKNVALARASLSRVICATALLSISLFATTHDAHARDNSVPNVSGVCALDVDGDGRVLPNDLLMAMRVALGMSGANVTNGITFTNASRNTPAAISAFLAGTCSNSMNCGLDLDNDTRVLSTTDLLLGLRVAFRVRDNIALDATALNGINFPVTATRTTWNAIRDFLVDCRDINPSPPQVSGVLYLSVGNNGQGATGAPSGLIFTEAASGIVADATRNSRFAYTTYIVTNNTGAALNNLCLSAVNAPGNLGGSAIYSVSNFASAGVSAAQFARSSKPSHKMNASTSTSVIDTANANLKLITAVEVGAGGGCGSILIDGNPSGVTTLEYGFVSSQASMPVGATSTIIVSYRLPGNNADNTSLTVSFGVSKDGSTRVSQSAEETVAQVNARATSTGVFEIAYSGPTAATAVPPSVVITAIRLADPKISVGTPAATLYGP
jgi:hypothetical protein